MRRQHFVAGRRHGGRKSRCVVDWAAAIAAITRSRLKYRSTDYYQNWYIQTAGFPNGSVFITSQTKGALLCARSGEKPALAQSSPLHQRQGQVSRRGAQASSAHDWWMVVNMPKATGGQKSPRLTRGFPMWAFLTINPRAGRNARPYPRKFLSARCKTKPTCRPRPA
jgi:hypothetical protein